MDNQHDIKVISEISVKLQPQVDHITDYFTQENIDSKLGEMSLIWMIAMSTSVRSATQQELESNLELSIDVMKNMAKLFFTLEKGNK